MPTSSEPLECPVCGSERVVTLGSAFEVYRCYDCGEHFEEEDPAERPHRDVRRRTRHNKYREDKEWN